MGLNKYKNMKKDKRNQKLIEKIISYIQAEQSRGFEAQTIVENLRNKFILGDIIKRNKKKRK